MHEKQIPDGIDAVFLPGKIHGAEHQAYIIYYNEQSDDGEGSWEIEVIDKERVLQLYIHCNGNAITFFDILPDMYQGEWYYCDRSSEEFADYENIYWDADFIMGRDGGIYEEMIFLVNWAKGDIQK